MTLTRWVGSLTSVNLKSKRYQRTWNSTEQWVGFRGSLEQILTRLWLLHCSRKKHISYLFPVNRLQDAIEISNQWHSAVVTLHTHLNPSGFKGGICAFHTLWTLWHQNITQNITLPTPCWNILPMMFCWNPSNKYISKQFKSNPALGPRLSELEVKINWRERYYWQQLYYLQRLRINNEQLLIFHLTGYKKLQYEHQVYVEVNETSVTVVPVTFECRMSTHDRFLFTMLLQHLGNILLSNFKWNLS